MFPFVILPIELATRLHEAHHGSDTDAVGECIAEILEAAFGDSEGGEPPVPRELHYWEDLPGGNRRYAVNGGWLYTLPRYGLPGRLFGWSAPLFIKLDDDILGKFPMIVQTMMRTMGIETPPLGGEKGAVLAMVRPEGEDAEDPPEEDPMEVLRRSALSGDPVAVMRFWVETGGKAPSGWPMPPEAVLESVEHLLDHLKGVELELEAGAKLIEEAAAERTVEGPWQDEADQWLARVLGPPDPAVVDFAEHAANRSSEPDEPDA